MNLRELYVKEIDGISLSEDFEKRTVDIIRQRTDRKHREVPKGKKSIKILAAAIAVILLLSVTVFAFSYLLSAEEIADNLGEKDIAELFKDSETQMQTVSNGIYDVIFLGKATGTALSFAEGFDAEEAKTYAVFAIRRTDGTALSLGEGMPLQLAPVIEGYMPYRTWNVLVGASGFEYEGVLYYLFDYENLEIFADRTVSVAVIEGDLFPTAEILTLDGNGKVVYGEEYEGMKGIFDLPMDKAKADPKAAEELLSYY